MKTVILIVVTALMISPAMAYDTSDLAGFASDWLTDHAGHDYNSDGIVNFLDFAHLAANWQPVFTYCPNKPDQAGIIAPANHATDLPTNTVVSWSVTDCNGERPKVDVWFGHHLNMTRVLSNSDANQYSPSLTLGYQWDWRIDTINSKGTTTGTVWTFNTAAAPANQAPIAYDIDANCVVYTATPVTLSATDDGLPYGVLLYIVYSLPTQGYLQDPQNGGHIVLPNELPYVIPMGGNVLDYRAISTSPVSFTYKAYDVKLLSNLATVSITNTTGTPYLTFANSGYVSSPNNVNMNVKSGWAVQSVFKTRVCDGVIMSKRDTTGKGWDMTLHGGKVSFGCYDSNKQGVTVTGESRVNTGDWIYCMVGCKSGADPQAQIYINTWQNNSEVTLDVINFNIPGLSDAARYTCNAPLIFAGTNYDGSLSRTRFFSNVDPSSNTGMSVANSPLILPSSSTEETAMGMGYSSNLRWMMNDGTGTTVREDKASVNGSVFDGNSPYWREFQLYYSQSVNNSRNSSLDCDCNPIYRNRPYRGRSVLKSQNF